MISLTEHELAQLLKLEECVFQGREIPCWLAALIKLDECATLTIECHKDAYYLWLTSLYKAQASQQVRRKAKEDLERRYWNLMKEARDEMIKCLVKVLKMPKENAELLVQQAIANKRAMNLQSLMPASTVFKEMAELKKQMEEMK